MKRLEEMNKEMMLKSKKYAQMQKPPPGARRTDGLDRYQILEEEDSYGLGHSFGG